MADRGLRDLWAIVAALALVQAAMAAIGFAIPLWLGAAGASSFAIGIVASCYMAGFLIGARLAPERIAGLGHIRAFIFFAAIAGLAMLGFFAAGPGVAAIAVIELALGLAIAGLFATGESWIADAAPAAGRGRIIGLYYLIAKTGVMAGPFLVAGFAPGAAAGFMVMAALFFLAILPVATTAQAEPVPHPPDAFGLRELWREAPASLQAALVAGAVNGAVLQLYPVYLAGIAPAAGLAAVAAFNAFAQIGALATQWPAGLYSDRMDRRLVIAWLALFGALAALLLALLGGVLPVVLLLLLAGLWGAGSLSFYGVAVAHAVDRAGEGKATHAIAGLLMAWAFGATLGPVTAGALMSAAAGPRGLFGLAAVLLGLLALAMVYRRATHKPSPASEKEPFAPVSATSVNIAEFDPRQ